MACRVATHNRVRGNGFYHVTIRSNHSTISDCKAAHDGDVLPNPHIITDNGIPLGCRMPLAVEICKYVLVDVSKGICRHPIHPMISAHIDLASCSNATEGANLDLDILVWYDETYLIVAIRVATACDHFINAQS